jgi:hydroxymethylbilane synthase
MKYPNMRFVPIRGKIETRLEKMVSEKMDGTVLACAGLERMNYFDQLSSYKILPPELCVPAIGRGILGVECRKEDREVFDLLVQITDEKTSSAATAERFFLRQMNGNCDLPIGAFAEKNGQVWDFYAFLAENMDATGRQLHLLGDDPLSLAEQAVKELFSQKTYC